MSVARTRLSAAVLAGLLATTGLAAGSGGAVAAPSAPPAPSGTAASSGVSVVKAPEGTPQASIAPLAKDAGYEESEFFISGKASSYKEAGTWGGDGKWDVEVDEAGVPFTTRIVVDRPKDPKKFNGTVWVEWFNVTTKADAAPSFAQARDQILASGGAWVGVSAQKIGVETSKARDPRYAPLDIKKDAFSYDVFAAAGKVIREDAATVLGGLKPKRLIATGESQSAFRLTTYVNSIHHQAPVFDGFLIHSRFASSAPLREDGFFGLRQPKIRTDVKVPVFQLQTETDLGGWEAVRQENKGNVHTWEVAGAAHVDVYTIESSMGQKSNAAGVAWLMGCHKPVSWFPFHRAAGAGYAATERWVRYGLRPPAAKPLEIVNDVIQRDADGNAKGGVRLPDIDVPVAKHTGLGNTSDDPFNIWCPLFGTYTPFDEARLKQLYPTKADYVKKYRAKATAAALRGYLTPAGAKAAVAAAKAAYPLP